METEKIAAHFERQVHEYENLMEKLVPRYRKQHKIIQNLLHDDTGGKIRVLDLGCGNGVLSKLVLKKNPNAYVVGFDLTPKMLEVCLENLSIFNGRYELIQGDYRFDSMGGEYDMVLAGLTLHHLTWGQRKDFYKLIYDILTIGGSFILNDIIIDEDWETRNKQYDNWLRFIASNGEDPEYWYNKHKNKDFPVTLEDHFRWLQEAGFSEAKCHWRYDNFAVTSAIKQH
jgi:tRNA (cmo5U34)-methyltransferase